MPYPELKPGHGILPASHRRSICRIKCAYGAPEEQIDKRIGTGFLIARKAGTAFIATAGHMLYNHLAGRPVHTILVAFDLDGNQAYRTFTLSTGMAARCRVPQPFVDGGDAAGAFDYGLFRIDDPLDDMTLIPLSAVLPRSQRIKLIGYPSEASLGSRPYHAIAEIEESGHEGYDYVEQKTYEGMSGGPLLAKTKTDETIRAFGLHIRGNTQLRAVRFGLAVQASLKAMMT